MQLEYGDALELIKQVPDHSVDLVLTDPPFGITNAQWDRAVDWPVMWQELYRVAKPAAAFLMFASSKFTIELAASNLKHFRYKYVWEKTGIAPTGWLNCHRMPLKSYEEILVFYRKLPKFHPIKSYGHSTYSKSSTYNNSDECLYCGRDSWHSENTDGSRYPTDILKYDAVHNILKDHSTQKPVVLLQYLIETYTHKGDTVLDPFMGVGSTGQAAKECGRNFIGYECYEKYFDIAKQNLIGELI